MQLQFDSRGALFAVPTVWIPFADGKPRADTALLTRIESNRLFVDALTPGNYTLACTLEDRETRFVSGPYFTGTREVTLVADTTLETTLD